MSDLAEKLRGLKITFPLVNEAADRIEELEAELHGTVITAYHDQLMQDWQTTIVNKGKEIERLTARIEALEAVLMSDSQKADLLSKQHYRDRIEKLEAKTEIDKITMDNFLGQLRDKDRHIEALEAVLMAARYVWAHVRTPGLIESGYMRSLRDAIAAYNKALKKAPWVRPKEEVDAYIKSLKATS